MTIVWEYKVTADISLLNSLGEDGWELVAVANGGFFFKRPRG